MARRKKKQEDGRVGDYKCVVSHGRFCSCGVCRSYFDTKTHCPSPEVKTAIPNTLNARVAKAACDRSMRLQDFYLKLIERGLKTLEFDKI